MASLFERLDKGRPPPIETPTEMMIKQPRRSADRRTFLLDMLANGPVPATLVEERGAVHGFTRKQLRDARKQMNIIAIKEVGKNHGRWFWRLGG